MPCFNSESHAQRQWRIDLQYQVASEDFLALRIFTAAVVPRCPPRQVPPKQLSSISSCFWIISHVHHLSGEKENMLQTGHALIFFFLPDNIFSSLFHIKCQLLCFGTPSYRYANPKMQFIHMWPSLPSTAKQTGDALTTAACGSSEHNQENYLAQLQVVHHTTNSCQPLSSAFQA